MKDNIASEPGDTAGTVSPILRVSSGRHTADRRSRANGKAEERSLEAEVFRALEQDSHLIFESESGEDAHRRWLQQLLQESTRSGEAVFVVTATPTYRQWLMELVLPGMGGRHVASQGLAWWRPTRDYVCLERVQHLERRVQELMLRSSGRADDPTDESAPRDVTLDAPARWPRNSSPCAHRRRGRRRSRIPDPKARRRLPAMPDLSAAQLRAAGELQRWLEEPRQGLICQLAPSVAQALEPLISVSDACCLGSECPEADRCCVRRSRKLDDETKLVLCDYPSLLGPAPLQGCAVPPPLLPAHRIVVLAEAHLAAGEARKARRGSLGLDVIEPLVSALVELDAVEQAVRLWEVAREFFAELSAYVRSLGCSIWLEVCDPVDARALLAGLEDTAAVLTERSQDAPDGPRHRHNSRLALTISGWLEAALSLSDPNALVSLEIDARGSAVLCSEPIDVSNVIAAVVNRSRSVLVTSETLSSCGRFDHVRRELGLCEAFKELPASGAMTSQSRVLLVVPESLPDPIEHGWPRAVTCRFMDVLQKTRGRAFGSFSSAEVLLHIQNHARYLGVCIQKEEVDGPAAVSLVLPMDWAERVHSPVVRGETQVHVTDLIDRESASRARRPSRAADLTTAAGAVLGSAPADSHPVAYSPSVEPHFPCLIIDRLPFPSSSNPLMRAMKEREHQCFARYVLPRAVLAFRQAVRKLLLWSPKYAVVVVMDRRILTRPYGRAFTSALPNVSVTRRLDDIGPFLKREEVRQ